MEDEKSNLSPLVQFQGLESPIQIPQREHPTSPSPPPASLPASSKATTPSTPKQSNPTPQRPVHVELNPPLENTQGKDAALSALEENDSDDDGTPSSTPENPEGFLTLDEIHKRAPELDRAKLEVDFFLFSFFLVLIIFAELFK